jgi:hypothetical protein
MSLQEKLERARKNLQNSLESANELVEDSEVEDIVKIDMSNNGQTDVIQLNSLVEDFGFIRETLRENAENGRRVLRTIALDLMNSDEEMKSSLVLSFAELNKAIAENIKLYMVTYKSISETLKNIQTLESKTSKPKESMSDVKVISTSDVLEELRNAE